MDWDEKIRAKKEVEEITEACKLFVKENVAPEDKERGFYYCIKKFHDEDEMMDPEDLEKWGLKPKS
jgi:hypothetical protein